MVEERASTPSFSATTKARSRAYGAANEALPSHRRAAEKTENEHWEGSTKWKDNGKEEKKKGEEEKREG